jgi:membrane protein
LNNVFGFLYVSRVVSNSKIYGSLGLVPVFMIGLYFSWLILLFGAQVAYAFQNRSVYLQEKLAENVNQRGREFIALRLMTGIGQRFQHGLPPATIQEISTELGIPSRLAQQVLQTLLAARLITEVGGAEGAYVPARPLESINAYQILHALRAGGGQELPMRDEPARAEVYGEFARIEEAERQAASSVTILALVNRASTLRSSLATEDGQAPQLAAPQPEMEKQSSAGYEASRADEPKASRMKVEAPPPRERKTNGAVPPPPAAQPPKVVVPDEDQEFPL